VAVQQEGESISVAETRDESEWAWEGESWHASAALRCWRSRESLPCGATKWINTGESEFDARRFRFDYLFNFLVFLELLFFRIYVSSLRWLSCLCVLKHSFQWCITDSSSAY